MPARVADTVQCYSAELMSLFQRGLAAIFIAVTSKAAFTATPAARQQAGTPAPGAPDVKTLGPQLGEKIPDFNLRDQYGEMRTLASLMGPKGLVLVFNRSAEW